MKKFTCGHCGGRIAVTPKHLGKLVVCPDCGKPTHPLAADILATAGPAAPLPPKDYSGAMLQRSCENCGRLIGRLELLQVWSNHLVCSDCHTHLARPGTAAPPGPSESRSRRSKVKEDTALLPTPAGVAEPSQSLLPVVVDRAETVPARRDATLAGGGITFDPGAMRVAVGRVASAASTVATVANLPPSQLRHRLLILLALVCFTGVAIYGALTLLRDLAGLITTLALILLAATAIVALLRTSLGLVGKWRSLRKEKPDAKADRVAEG